MDIVQTFYDSLADHYDKLFLACGCSRVCWLFPEETGFYQPIILAKK